MKQRFGGKDHNRRRAETDTRRKEGEAATTNMSVIEAQS